MSTSLSVRSEADAVEPGQITAVIASLPVSLHHASDEPDLVAVAGSEGWTERATAAIRAGAKGIMVVNPRIEDSAGLTRLSTSRTVPVVIDTSWRHNPSVAVMAEHFRKLDSLGQLLETRVQLRPETPTETGVVAHLALVEAVVGPISSVRLLHTDQHGYRGLAVSRAGAQVALVAVRTSALPAAASLRLIGPEHIVELEVPDAQTAAPATATIFYADESRSITTPYENAHRAAWRLLHASVAGAVPTSDLEWFNADRSAASALLGP